MKGMCLSSFFIKKIVSSHTTVGSVAIGWIAVAAIAVAVTG